MANHGGIALRPVCRGFRATGLCQPDYRRRRRRLGFDHIDRELSWRTALIYKPLPNGSLYFDAGNSFNPSAEALLLSLATAPLPPVETITYEIGTKMGADRRGALDQWIAFSYQADQCARA